ncbi:hypothetical protein [Nonomuraea sp. SBT364]|uniref:hypothetical protein n=1 Tax=Nonomuraea sp. SBT364 TaxID=1580530 RepID=UPI00066E31AA|nr:hypothetical protein [Nonomuraea sp. SBT364]
MKRPAKRHSIIVDPVLIIGTGLSVLLAVIFYVREDAAQALGTVAGLIGGVITLQIQTLLREKRRIDHETRVGHMVSTIEKIPWLPDLMEPMLRAAKHVEREYKGTPAEDACRNAFEECLRTLADLERGHFRAPYGDAGVFLKLIEQSRESMCVTSVPSVDLTWWLQPVGRQYWQAQVDALKRGVVIRRVFIYHEWTDGLDALAREQLEAGVKVRRVHVDRLPPAMRVITGVWDEACGHELSYTAAGEAVHDTFTVSPPDLERLMRQFEMIERSATEVGVRRDPDPVS